MQTFLDENGLTVTLYKRPNGRSEEIFITKINPEQVQYFISNNIAVSMEDCGSFFAIYATEPNPVDEEDPLELTLLVKDGETCYTAMERLQLLCEEAFNEGYWQRPDHKEV